jgi:hypothetical protein
MKLTTSSDKELNTISALLYGDSGIGKTTSLKTLPVDRTLIACGERSLLPLRHHDYKVAQIETWDDVRNLNAAIRNPDSVEDKALKTMIQKATVLVVDSLSEVSEMCAKHILYVDRPVLTKERTGDKRTTPEKTYADKLTLEDFGIYRNRILNMVSAFTHLPLTVIFTCLADAHRNKDGNERYRTPNLPGKAGREVAAHFDIVLHMEDQDDGQGKEHRVWRTFHGDDIIAKDASGALDLFEPPNWTDLFTKILSNEKGETK